jgi:PAS domain S-box-containing protein
MLRAPRVGTARLSPRGDLLDLDDVAAAIAGYRSAAEAKAAGDLAMMRGVGEWARSPEAAAGPAAFDQRWHDQADVEHCSHFVVAPVRDGAAELARFDVLVEDACDRMDADRARLFLETIVEGLPNPVFVKDEQHRWVLLNEASCQLIGHERGELLGKSDYDFFPKSEADVFWMKDDLVFTSGALNENEELITDAAGKEHSILTRKGLRVDAEGRRYLVGVITDITDRKEMEEELRRSRDLLEVRVRERTAELERANQRLEDQDRRKNQFLGVLSHELRNPLEPILNALYILDHAEPGGERAYAAREVIGRQLDHLTRLVDDLLDVTRISRGKIHLHREAVDLAKAVHHTVDDHRSLFASRGVELRVEAPAGPLTVNADPARVVQIVGNLLQNAAKFTNSGGRVTVALAQDEGRAVLRVSDSGVGIDPGILPRLFEPFTQADESLHRSSGGLGLGLALVKGLAELHGGAVEARSEGRGRGAEIIVRLPIADGEARARVRPRPPSASRHRRVLVIEDNLDAAETLRVVLEMSGHMVEVAHDGRDGVARARAFRPDLIICDIGLPEMDGYAVARAIRSDPALASVDLVALTGYALAEDQRRAREAGFDRHLAKPAPLEEIEAVLGETSRGA